MKRTLLRIGLLALSILGISLLHYFTPLHLHYLHDIFQRLYYLPIILAAFWFGFRGGLVCSIVVSLVYVPHVLFQWGGEMTVEMEKYLEIVLYNVVGGVTGWLAQRERERSQELERSAAGLDASYRALQSQSERMMAIEEQLRRSERLSTLGEMAAVLAHEIRNPLGSIRGTAEILRDDYPPGDPKFEFLEIQIKETERLNRVVEDFLRMARPQASEAGPCSLRDELETIRLLTLKDAREREVSLALPSDSERPVVMADGEKLRQAFLNIVINALQATPRGGSVTISTRIVRPPAGGDQLPPPQAAARSQEGEPSFCEIRFADTGPGMDQETLSQAFEPFFTTKPDGTGLGLAITKKIIEGHGGTMAVESEPGKGTTVVVALSARPGGQT